MRGVAVKPNRSRDCFVAREMANQVLEACPDNEWRLNLALWPHVRLTEFSPMMSLTWRLNSSASPTVIDRNGFIGPKKSTKLRLARCNWSCAESSTSDRDSR
jgi:hypothetical protein